MFFVRPSALSDEARWSKCIPAVELLAGPLENLRITSELIAGERSYDSLNYAFFLCSNIKHPKHIMCQLAKSNRRR